MASTRAPLWTWAHRLQVAGYVLVVASCTVLAVAAVLDQEWWKLAFLAAFAVVASQKFIATVRGASSSQYEAEERRRRARTQSAR